MRVCHFEDQHAGGLEPLAMTRPVFQLRCGALSLADKQRRHFQATDWGVLVRPSLAELHRQEFPGVPVNDLAWLRQGPTVMVSGRWLAPPGEVVAKEPHVALIGDEVAYAFLGPEQWCNCSPEAMSDGFANWKEKLPHRPAPGIMIRFPWDLVEHNASELRHDFTVNQAGKRGQDPAGIAVLGPRDQLWIAPTAKAEPMVVIDTSSGPVAIDEGAVVSAFTRIEGPCYVGPGTHILGAKIRGGCSFGPQCRIGGEVEATIVHGYSNKYHDGFLGHSYIGEWVNLAAGTNNSDLRNDYGAVNVPLGLVSVRTGLTKVGCFIGDHTKTALATQINTGSNIGIFCNLIPGGTLAPKYVPPFTQWWKGSLQETTDVHKQLATAATVMSRRGRELTPAHLQLYQQLFDDTAFLRLHASQDTERRRAASRTG